VEPEDWRREERAGDRDRQRTPVALRPTRRKHHRDDDRDRQQRRESRRRCAL
jgi:hypothetical protein